MTKNYKYVRLYERKVLHKISNTRYTWSTDYTKCGIDISVDDSQFITKPKNSLLCKKCFR